MTNCKILCKLVPGQTHIGAESIGGDKSDHANRHKPLGADHWWQPPMGRGAIVQWQIQELVVDDRLRLSLHSP